MVFQMPARPYAQSAPPTGTGLAFATWLKAARATKGWTGERLAEQLATSQGTISMYERGLRHPHRERAVEIAKALGADPEEALKALMADTPGLEGELESIPDDEELQRRIVAYDGPNPILSAAAATAKGMKEILDRAKVVEEGEALVAKGRRPRKTLE